MRELLDTQSIIEAAKEAAAANDYASAEALLRKAVLLQETELGPIHPDLASTVNNLGIVCEMNDKPADAEACFRRAYTIATHSLGPDHVLVTTSRQNLRDFCAARGKPFELPDPLPAVTTPTSAPPDAAPVAAATNAPPDPAPVTASTKAPPNAAAVTAAAKMPPEAASVTRSTKPTPDAAVVMPPAKATPNAVAVTPPTKPRPDAAVAATQTNTRRGVPNMQPDVRAEQPRRATPVASRAVPRVRFSRALVMGGLGPAVMLIVIVAARPWLGSTEGHESAPAVATAPPNGPEPSPVAPAFEPSPVATESPKATTESPIATESRIAKADVRGTIETSRPVRLVVVRAQLCAELVDWHCDPPDRPIPSGQLFFYTQVKAASGTTVQHRWYQGDRLQHSVDLRVDASPGVGYRSFSRYTMKGENAGNWRVELRTEDGVLLQEERFSVQ